MLYVTTDFTNQQCISFHDTIIKIDSSVLHIKINATEKYLNNDIYVDKIITCIIPQVKKSITNIRDFNQTIHIDEINSNVTVSIMQVSNTSNYILYNDFILPEFIRDIVDYKCFSLNFIESTADSYYLTNNVVFGAILSMLLDIDINNRVETSMYTYPFIFKNPSSRINSGVRSIDMDITNWLSSFGYTRSYNEVSKTQISKHLVSGVKFELNRTMIKHTINNYLDSLVDTIQVFNLVDVVKKTLNGLYSMCSFDGSNDPIFIFYKDIVADINDIVDVDTSKKPIFFIDVDHIVSNKNMFTKKLFLLSSHDMKHMLDNYREIIDSYPTINLLSRELCSYMSNPYLGLFVFFNKNRKNKLYINVFEKSMHSSPVVKYSKSRIILIIN